MKKLKEIDYKILSELVKDPKISDREIAEKLSMSKPTVSRRKARLQKNKVIQCFAVPDFEEFGFDVLAFTFAHYKPSIRTNLPDGRKTANLISETLKKHPNIIFASSGQGLGYEAIALSIHKDYADYADFKKSLNTDWGKYVQEIDSFTVSMKGDNVGRPLTFEHASLDFISKLLHSKI